MKQKVLLVLYVLCLLSFDATDPTINYIKAHKHLAIQESTRSGIPASVILAQGIHETNSGRSKLATIANNHFGIKCKSYWKGKTYRHKDDDYDKQGNLLNSCFRAYDSVEDSYRDHTDFLMHSTYYTSLFGYAKKDYVRWAYGLRKCGYATDEIYAEKLVRIIKKHKLYLIDNQFDRVKEEKVGTKFVLSKTSFISLPDNYQRKRYMDK